MTAAYLKRLIEVDLPITQLSECGREEKGRRMGHVPRVHVYPAAKPASVCRAVVCAALWPDPVCLASASQPEGREFLRYAPDRIRQWAGRGRVVGGSMRSHVEAMRADPCYAEEPELLRSVLLSLIADSAAPSIGYDSGFVSLITDLTRAAAETTGVSSAAAMMMLDPFAGSGAIPMEAQRCGLGAIASDINPLAVTLNRILNEYIPKYGTKLADIAEAWLDWLDTGLHASLRDLYPADADGSIPVAYIWARTVLSEEPIGGESPVEVPLISDMRLSRGRRQGDWALIWVRDTLGNVKCDIAQRRLPDGASLEVRQPVLEVRLVSRGHPVDPPTVKGGAATCPVSGFTTPVRSIRRQLEAEAGGADTARMICVVLDSPAARNRWFRSPLETDLAGYRAAAARMGALGTDWKWMPSAEELPPQGTIGFRVRKYGVERWSQLYNRRQLLVLATYAESIPDFLDAQGLTGDLADAVSTALALVIDRLADLNSSLCVWQRNTPNTSHVFGRWALHMVFDYGEVNPLAAAGGSPASAVKRLAAYIRETAPARSESTPAQVMQADAQRLPLPDDSVGLVFTDPPYYDAIPYADLLDYFSVWLSRTLPQRFHSMFVDGLSPKKAEIVVDESKGKSQAYFASAMRLAMNECRRVVDPSGLAVVVFAHKGTAGWEAQLEALVESGWRITASWPIDTEMTSRLRAQNSAALSSSVHLVCRPRENPDGSLFEETGEWREVLSELPARIHEWMPRLAAEGVVGADAIFACLGPALEIFSRYSRVEKSSGEAVPLREFLEQVWAAVSREALSMIFDDPVTSGLEPDARLTAMWLWTLGASVPRQVPATSVDDEGSDQEQLSKPSGKASGYNLEFDAARKIAQGLGIHLEKASSVVKVKGDEARLLSVAERTRYLFGVESDGGLPARKQKKAAQLDLFAELHEVDAEVSGSAPQLATPGAGRTVLDRVHQAMILFAAGRGEAVKRFLVEDGIGKQANFWKLAQALSALYPAGSDEKRWVDGVLARKKGLGL